MRRDLASAYVASAAKIGSWVVVYGLVYRFAGEAEAAMLALVRGTIGLLNYTSLGIAPALISRAGDAMDSDPVPVDNASTILSYRSARRDPLAIRYANSLVIAFGAAGVGLLLTILYASVFDTLFKVPSGAGTFLTEVVVLIGFGIVFRLTTDVAGAVLQLRNRIALDNVIVAGGDVAWAALVAGTLPVFHRWLSGPEMLLLAALEFFVSGVAFVVVRPRLAFRETGVSGPHRNLIDADIVRSLVQFGVLVTIAQLADYLYAPTDYILINRLLSPVDVANYAPAVQIDAGLLLLVTGLSGVLLPKAALAHAAGSSETVRTYYIRGTLASLALLSVAGAAVWVISPFLFRLWLGKSMPVTQVILPLVLTHTVLGGSSAVGRSILLGIGKVKPFTIAVLIAGATNVVCSFVFVRYCGLGLKGIVLGTIVAVVGRCAIWMPWYTLRAIRRTSVQLPTVIAEGGSPGLPYSP